MIKQFFADIAEAWNAGSPKRDAFWYLAHHFITPSECLLLEQYPENEGNDDKC